MDNETKKITDMSKNELLEILMTALNKCCKNGHFTIDEAFTLKIIYNQLKELNNT
jgi:hypothetical protein